MTVFGESAGAGSIAALLVMPGAAGLFGRAIAQSVPGTFCADALARDVAAAIAGEAGLRPAGRELSGVNPRQLAAAGRALEPKMRQYEDRRGSLGAHAVPLLSRRRRRGAAGRALAGAGAGLDGMWS